MDASSHLCTSRRASINRIVNVRRKIIGPTLRRYNSGRSFVRFRQKMLTLSRATRDCPLPPAPTTRHTQRLARTGSGGDCGKRHPRRRVPQESLDNHGFHTPAVVRVIIINRGDPFPVRFPQIIGRRRCRPCAFYFLCNTRQTNGHSAPENKRAKSLRTSGVLRPEFRVGGGRERWAVNF